MCSTIAMAPGSSLQPHNAMKDKEGGRREKNSQEAGTSGVLGLLTSVDVNRMHVDSNQQSWPALSKSILPPPKKRHHLANQNTAGQPAPKVMYMDCKENKSDRGGSLTSRISSLSPGTKRKMLGYAADGSIPPLPPRQKRVKKFPKLTSGEGKLCTKYARSSEPSGLLGDLKPGIMRQQTRTRTEIHALLSAVVGDLLQRDSLSAADSLCYEIQVSDKFSEEPPIECSDLNRWSEETSDQPTGTSLQDSLDGNPDSPKLSGQSITEKNSRFVDAVDGHFDVGLRKCKGVINTTERTSGFVPFQRNGQHACNRNVPVLPAHMPAVAQRDATSHSQQAQLPVTMKQERDIPLFHSRTGLLSEAFECKQEDLEEDACEYPFDLSSLSEDAGSLRHEDAQRQESQLLMPVSGANVATCWLELLSLDVKGRLAALKRSKRRVGSVIESGELDLDAPLLPGCATSPPILNHYADGQPPVESWRKVFESMDRALTLEGQKLKSWLQQIHVMQGECQRDMTLSSSIRPTSFSEPPPASSQDVQQVTVPLATASKISTASFTSQLAEYRRLGNAMKRPRSAAAAASRKEKNLRKKNQEEAERADEEAQAPPVAKKRRNNNNNNNETEQSEQPDDAPKVANSNLSNLQTSDSPLLVFAHGAGANSSHEWMVRWKKLLGEATNAVEVVTFDYPYCANGKKGAPPKAEKLVGSHMEEIRKAISRHPGHPLVLVGKSMGSRVSCMVAGHEDTEVAAVVCLGYPLKGANGTLRDQTLLELPAPVLFVQGSKDSMCPLTELEKVRKKMTVMNEVHVVEGGDHYLKIGKRASNGVSQDESDHKALDCISAFIAKALIDTK